MDQEKKEIQDEETRKRGLKILGSLKKNMFTDVNKKEVNFLTDAMCKGLKD